MRTAWTCPVCGGSAVGRVGQNQYYCRDCFLEFSPVKDGYRVYEIRDDGSLLAWEDCISG